ncbi:hypothetical protein SAMN05216369_0210 [Marinobacter antarcticus]|uniref:Uncharacterized protein n=1 Tax=Marinobacter antarcticus TaxID=564117 RepID=A0A1M6PCC2_9GAMM|nr:hypothetical protein SAMN05216369_0210 [Marinobacter antarcticus]
MVLKMAPFGYGMRQFTAIWYSPLPGSRFFLTVKAQPTASVRYMVRANRPKGMAFST